MAVLQIGAEEPLNRYLQAILKAGKRSAETVRQLLAITELIRNRVKEH